MSSRNITIIGRAFSLSRWPRQLSEFSNPPKLIKVKGISFNHSLKRTAASLHFQSPCPVAAVAELGLVHLRSRGNAIAKLRLQYLYHVAGKAFGCCFCADIYSRNRS